MMYPPQLKPFSNCWLTLVSRHDGTYINEMKSLNFMKKSIAKSCSCIYNSSMLCSSYRCGYCSLFAEKHLNIIRVCGNQGMVIS